MLKYENYSGSVRRSRFLFRRHERLEYPGGCRRMADVAPLHLSSRCLPGEPAPMCV